MNYYYRCAERHNVTSSTLYDEEHPCPARAEGPDGSFGPECGAPLGVAFVAAVEFHAEIERLRGLVADRHHLVDGRDEHGRLVMWRCSCNEWRAKGSDSTKFHDHLGPALGEDEAKAAHAKHVADLLD